MDLVTFSKLSFFCLVFLNNSLCYFEKSPDPVPCFWVTTVVLMSDIKRGGRWNPGGNITWKKCCDNEKFCFWSKQSCLTEATHQQSTHFVQINFQKLINISVRISSKFSLDEVNTLYDKESLNRECIVYSISCFMIVKNQDHWPYLAVEMFRSM